MLRLFFKQAQNKQQQVRRKLVKIKANAIITINYLCYRRDLVKL
jgi:hypothetical protein